MLTIAILIEDHYQVLEAWYPYLYLRGKEMKTLFVGPGRKTEFTSKEGYPAEADMPVKEARESDFDGVIIPGGYAPDLLRRNEYIVDFVRNMHDRGKLVAAICHAAWVAVSAGILKGRKVTCFKGIKDDVINAGAEYADEEVVVHGNFITSRKPSDLPAFCREIVIFLRENNPIDVKKE